MSIIAQNCLAPGIVTLLANLTKPRRVKVFTAFSAALKHFVIPHLDIRACDWSKSHHMTVNKSR